MSIEMVLETLANKIALLEAEIEGLKKPKLMYKRPGDEEHEKLTEYLDDVEFRLQVLER